MNDWCFFHYIFSDGYYVEYFREEGNTIPKDVE